MKKIDEVKDEIAQKHGFGDWQSVVIYCCNNYKFSTLNKYENEAMQEYGRLCCVEQRIQCKKQYQDNQPSALKWIANSIENAKLATEL